MDMSDRSIGTQQSWLGQYGNGEAVMRVTSVLESTVTTRRHLGWWYVLGYKIACLEDVRTDVRVQSCSDHYNRES
jgi:hypothetical protein